MATDPPSFEYFTSFEQTGEAGFLNYISWINANQGLSTNVDQSSAEALTGTRSCLFSEGTFGTSELVTKSLFVPVGSATATLAGWIYAGASNVAIDVHIQIDGTDHVSRWQFTNDDIGSWVPRSFSVELPSSAQSFIGKLKLRSNSQLDTNQFWLDSYGVDFAPQVATQDPYCLIGDTGGQVYAFPSSASGTSPAPAWTRSLSGGQVLAPIAVAAGVAYVVVSGDQASLYALDSREGTPVWSQPASLPAATEVSAVVFGTRVIAVGNDGWLRTFNTADGSPDWACDFGQAGLGNPIQINGAVVAENILYVTANGGACAVDLSARSVKWTAANRFGFTYPAAIGHGAVYTGCTDGALYALDARTGTTLWKYQTEGSVASEPQVIGSTIMFGSDDGNIYVVDTGTHALISKLPLPGTQVTVNCFLYDSNMLFAVANAIDGGAYGFSLSTVNNAWTWTRKWSLPLRNGAQGDPAIDGKHVYLAAADGNVHSLAITDGNVAWSCATQALPIAAAVTAAAPIPTASRKFSDMCWLCTHNAFANSEEGWFWLAQQGPSIEQQLTDGVRALMLDIWLCDDQVVYAHGGCSFKTPFTSFLPFATGLATIKSWLDANPNEVVTLFLEQRTRRKDVTQAAFAASGIASYLYDPHAANVIQNGWPTIASMVAAGKRLLIFSDWGWGGNWINGGDGFPYVWSYCVENKYGDASRDGTCDPRPSSDPIQSGANMLFIQNYNTSFSANPVETALDDDHWSRFDRINDSNLIMQSTGVCQGRWNRLPNFLAVDWYRDGFNGGPRRAVAQINKLGNP